MDNLSLRQRHKNMSAIKAKNTKPEVVVRKYLWHNGLRYRLNCNRLPGKPDIVLKRYRTCIFVNGCFWHRHFPCKKFRMPKSNVLYWETKLQRNVDRDVLVKKKLTNMGWHCITVWECELTGKKREETLKRLMFTLNHIFLLNHSVKYELQEDDMSIAAEPLGKFC